MDVVLGGAGIIDALPLHPHHVDEGVEGGLVIVEQKNIFSSTHQLLTETMVKDYLQIITLSFLQGDVTVIILGEDIL